MQKRLEALILGSFDEYYPRLRSWFSNIPDAETGRFLIRQFEAGDVFVEKNHLFQHLYIVLDGICNVINQLDNGMEIITLKLTSGDLVGDSESVLGSMRSIAFVKACTRLIAAEMDNSMFQDWLKRYPSFTDYVMKNLVTRLH